MRILFVGGEDSLPPDLIDLVGGMDESWDVQCVGDGATATAANESRGSATVPTSGAELQQIIEDNR